MLVPGAAKAGVLRTFVASIRTCTCSRSRNERIRESATDLTSIFLCE